ncbi:hypothetical protein BFN01_04155 [Microbacterium sp. AR7-10]|nr:hypothetical protein BFN01_04155 [Microbacterium sp. AR7-10]
MNDQGRQLKDVAKTADISASQLSRVFNGLKVFTLDQLDAVCAALDLSTAMVIAKADAATADRPLPRIAPLPTIPRIGVIGFNVGAHDEDQALAASDDADWQARQEHENE